MTRFTTLDPPNYPEFSFVYVTTRGTRDHDGSPRYLVQGIGDIDKNRQRSKKKKKKKRKDKAQLVLVIYRNCQAYLNSRAFHVSHRRSVGRVSRPSTRDLR